MPTDTSSTGRHDSTSRQYVLGRVNVPIVPGATTRTRPVPGGKGQLREQVPADRACFRTGVPPIDDNEGATGTLTLVFKLPAELAPSSVTDHAGEALVPYQAPHVEILDRDQIGAADQTGGCPVQKVLPGMTHLPVSTSYLRLGSDAVTTAWNTVGHSPLVAGQVTSFAFRMTGVGDSIAVAGHGKILDTKIYADLVASRAKRLGQGRLDSECHIPTTVGLTRHHHCGRVERTDVFVERPHVRQRTGGLRKVQLAIADPESRPGVMCRLAPDARLEPRMLRSTREKIAERGMLVAKGLLQSYRRHLGQERKLIGLLPSSQCGVGLSVRGLLSLSMVATMSFGQRTVPDQPYAAKCADQDTGLLRTGVCPTSVRRPHIDHLTQDRMSDKSDTPDRRSRAGSALPNLTGLDKRRLKLRCPDTTMRSTS